MERVTFALSGMTCGHCVASVTKALKNIDGIRNVAMNEVTVDIDGGRTSKEEVAKTLAGVGYPVVSTSAA